MTQPSETERLKQIRERLAKNELAPYAPDEWWADTHFLLSLIDTRAPVDSQGSAELPEWSECQSMFADGTATALSEFIRAYEPVQSTNPDDTAADDWRKALSAVVHDAATQMRDACVERLGQVDRAHILSNNQDYERGFRDAIRSAQTALSSLTLEVKQEEK